MLFVRSEDGGDGMTNEEAVKMLRTMQRTVYLGNRKFEDAIECAIKALSEPLQPWEVLAAQSVLSQPEPHWIPVTERPPEVGKSVMICDAYGDICIGHRTNVGYYFPDFCEDKIKDVRAWAELPEPYKEVTE